MRTSITFEPVGGVTVARDVETLLGPTVIAVFRNPAPKVAGKPAQPINVGIMAPNGSPAADTIRQMADPSKAHFFEKVIGVANGFGEGIRLDLLKNDGNNSAEKEYISIVETALTTDPAEGPSRGGVASFLIYTNYIDVVPRSSIEARAVIGSDGADFLPQWENFEKRDEPKLDANGNRLMKIRPPMRSFIQPEVPSRNIRLWAESPDVTAICDSIDSIRTVAVEGRLLDIPWGEDNAMDGLQIKLDFICPKPQRKDESKPQHQKLENQVAAATATDYEDHGAAAAAFGTKSDF